MMFFCVAIFGVMTIIFGLSRSLWLSLAALVILGAADMVSVVIRSSLLQLATPPSMRGRVSAVNSLFVGASNELGEYESGLVGDAKVARERQGAFALHLIAEDCDGRQIAPQRQLVRREECPGGN